MEPKKRRWNNCKGCGTNIQFGEYCVECLSKDISLLPLKIREEVIQRDEIPLSKMLTIVMRLMAIPTLKKYTRLKLIKILNKKLIEGKEQQVFELIQEIETKKVKIEEAIKILEGERK